MQPDSTRYLFALICKEDQMVKRPGSRFLTILVALSSVLMLFASACAPQGTPTTSNSSKPQRGGIWVDDLFNEPDALIPNASVQTFATIVNGTLYSALFEGDASGQIRPALAAELPTQQNGGISSDLKTWKFTLKPGLKWSDGQPLNADDVYFSWKTWSNPSFAAASTVAVRLIESAEVSSDKLSITFHLSKPFAPFIASWTDGSLAPLPKHHFESMNPGDIKKTEGLDPQVTSGPFKMKESKPGDHYTVVRNDNYYLASQGLPYLDEIVFRAVPSQDTILKDLQAGTADSAWFLDVTKTPSYKALSNYEIVTNPSASYEGLHINSNNPIFKDLNVRKAMAMAIDRVQLQQVARLGQAIPLCTDHGPAYHPGYQQDLQCPPFDIAGANKVLDDAGWKLGSDNVRQKGGQRLEFQYSTTANNRWREKDQALIQANFAKIGIKLDITNYPGSTFFGPFLNGGQPGKYDLAEWASSYTYDPDDAASFACNQIPPHGQNLNFFCDPSLDQLFQQEQAISDPTQRQQVFNQIHQAMLDKLPFIGLYNLIDLEIHKKGTHNYKPGPFANSETVGVAQWWCDNGKCPA